MDKKVVEKENVKQFCELQTIGEHLKTVKTQGKSSLKKCYESPWTESEVPVGEACHYEGGPAERGHLRDGAG